MGRDGKGVQVGEGEEEIYDREGEEGEMDAVAVTEGELAAGKLVGEAATTRAYTALDVTVTVS